MPRGATGSVKPSWVPGPSRRAQGSPLSLRGGPSGPASQPHCRTHSEKDVRPKGAWCKKSRAMGLVQSHSTNSGDRKLVCRRNLEARARRWEGGHPAPPLHPPPGSLPRTPHPAGPPRNCSMGRSSDMVRASWWVWASRRPGKVRKAPSREPATASPTRMASLTRGRLGEREGSGGSCGGAAPCVQVQPATALPPFPALTPSPSLASSEGAPSSGTCYPGLGKTKRGRCPTDPRAQSPLCLASQMSICSPGEDTRATARPCDKHEDKLVLQSGAAQNVPGRHS